MQALLLEDVFQDCDPEDAELATEEEPLEATKESGAGLIISQEGHTTTGSKRKRSSHQLRKKERVEVVETLKIVTGAILLDGVVKQLSEELHMQHYPERAELLRSLLDSCEQELKKICTSHAASFIEVYTQCSTGKEKYGRFQVKWHQSCSRFLLDAPSDTECYWSSLSPPRLRLTMTRSVPKDVHNPVMIAMMSAIYGCMLQKAHEGTTVNNSDTDSHHRIEREDDEVYLRFGGGALADMFQT